MKEWSPPLPPYRILEKFLDQDMVLQLLAYSVENEGRFEPTQVNWESEVVSRPSMRVSRMLCDLGPFKQYLKTKILELTPGLVSELRVSSFEPSGVELEIIAHGDGAFYKRHIDTYIGLSDEAKRRTRMLTGVYYFHKLPKVFSGGEIRLYAFGSTEDNSKFVDIEPVHNTFLVFPSWASHEVLPVSCPSGEFANSRFAINCWVYQKNDAQHSEMS